MILFTDGLKRAALGVARVLPLMLAVFGGINLIGAAEPRWWFVACTACGGFAALIIILFWSDTRVSPRE